MARRIFMFVLGVALGYCTGFTDARHHEDVIVVRAVERVQGVVTNTLGERAEKIDRRAEELEGR